MERSRTILIADDDRGDVSLVSYALRQAGFKNPIRWLKNGDLVIRYLRRNHTARKMPLLVLIDWNMPRTNPIQLLNWIRNQPEYLSLLVVVLTGSDDPAEKQHAYSAGANWHIVKSANFAELTALTQRVHEFWTSSVRHETSA